MKQLLKILTVDSVKDLFKYRSFFALIFLLILLDRVLHVDSGIRLPSWHEMTAAAEGATVYVFTKLFDQMVQVLFQWRTLLILAGLFVIKQIVSLWPSSDMRRMHRNERGGAALIKALVILRWHQFLWDALAVGILVGGACLWSLLWFLLCRAGWKAAPGGAWLPVWGLLVFAITPLVLAGFSYSSKVAVLSRGSFLRKFALFLALFTDKKVLFPSWIFYLVRQCVEGLFVVAIPAAILIFVSQPWLRIPLAGLLATPVYALLKMASFKFFLHVYAGYPEIREEYRAYFDGQPTEGRISDLAERRMDGL